MLAPGPPGLMGWGIGVASWDAEGEGDAVVGGRVERVERLELVEGLEACLQALLGVAGDWQWSGRGLVAFNFSATSFDSLPKLWLLPSSCEGGVFTALDRLPNFGGGLATAVAPPPDLVMRLGVNVSLAVVCEFASAILSKAFSAIVSISSANVFLSSATNLYDLHLERCRSERVDE